TEDSFAIALTGEWGIGKTHFWNNFYERNHTKFKTKKYAYVSLFGIESLESLKFEIALKSHSTSQKKDNFSFIKKSFQKSLDVIDFSKIEGKGIALSLSKGMISSAVSSMITDTVICIDDIERHSAKLDIKDIMGLVNQLNLEKNCKVVVILHEKKASSIFEEYKEKVFDEILILDNSLSIIRDIIEDDELFPIYKNFYETMHIRNLRFYQRVQQTYQKIVNASSTRLSDLSQTEILKQVLIIRLVYDSPQYLGINIEFLQTYFVLDSYLDEHIDRIHNDSDDEKKQIKAKKEYAQSILSGFYNHFHTTEWTDFVIELITDISIDDEKLNKLISEDLINEQNLQNEREKDILISEHHSLNAGDNFNQRLFENSIKQIGRETLTNLSFYCNTLNQNGEIALSIQLEGLVKDYIRRKVFESSDYWHKEKWYFFGIESYDIFYGHLVQMVEERKLEIRQINDIDLICEAFKRFYKSGYHSEELFEAMRDIQEDDLNAVLWQPIDDERDRKQYIRKTLQHPAFRFRKIVQTIFTNGVSLSDENWILVTSDYRKNILPTPYQPSIIILKAEEVKRWTLKLLKKRVNDNPNSKAAIENWLKYSNNLKNLNS
ncbi:P-loop NTPase fold protein, partial [Psychrobacter alimentarius]|uniref:P-loop NTPase fold protein n=1 Tax=Psychrobacter alimentarius TaxID=261164 RepID=UPI003FD159DF